MCEPRSEEAIPRGLPQAALKHPLHRRDDWLALAKAPVNKIHGIRQRSSRASLYVAA